MALYQHLGCPGPLWSIPTVPVILASASRLLPVPIGCWLSGYRQASPFQWVARRLKKGPGLYTITEAHKWERQALGKNVPHIPIIFHQLEVAKPGCSQWTCSEGNHCEALPKRQWVPLPAPPPTLRVTHPRGREGGETGKRVPDLQRHSVEIQTSPGALA